MALLAMTASVPPPPRDDRYTHQEAARDNYNGNSSKPNGNGLRRIQSSLASLATLTALLIQSGVAVWWAAGMSNDMMYMKDNWRRNEMTMSQVVTERWTASEHRQYRDDMESRLQRLEERVRQLEIRR